MFGATFTVSVSFLCKETERKKKKKIIDEEELLEGTQPSLRVHEEGIGLLSESMFWSECYKEETEITAVSLVTVTILKRVNSVPR